VGADGAVAVHEVSGLGGFGPRWDELVLQQPVATPFLRRWWLEATGSPQRRFVLVTSGGRLVGGAALDRDRLLGVPRYRFAAHGVLCPDHLDLLASPERREDVVTGFRSWFTGPGDRLLDLDGLPASSLMGESTSVASRPLDVAPYGGLPGSGEAWLAERSSSLRRSVRRSTARLASSGLRPHRVAPDGLDRALADFARLHATREGRHALLARMGTLRRAVTDGVARGEAWVHVLGSDQQCAAVSLSFVVGGRISLYQVARSTLAEHDGAGTALLSHVIAEAADAGLVEADLLRGGEDYKASFVTGTRSLHRLRAGNGPRARALVSATEGAARVRRGVRERLRSGAAARAT
jgi:CelD/BcsL family acetyltransferase involved in cellulose biosynthesis